MKEDISRFLSLFSKNELIFWGVILGVSILNGTSFLALGLLAYIISKIVYDNSRIMIYVLLGVEVILSDGIRKLSRLFFDMIIREDAFTFLGETIGERVQNYNIILMMLPGIVSFIVTSLILIILSRSVNLLQYKFLYYYLFIALGYSILNPIIYYFTWSRELWYLPNLNVVYSFTFILLLFQYLVIKFNIKFNVDDEVYIES